MSTLTGGDDEFPNADEFDRRARDVERDLINLENEINWAEQRGGGGYPASWGESINRDRDKLEEQHGNLLEKRDKGGSGKSDNAPPRRW